MIIFLLPLFSLLFINSLSYKKFAFHKITLTCNGDFIFYRICEDTTPINAAFIGTSKTLNGVNDLLIRFVYQHYFYQTFHPVVVSFCGGGRNIQYAIIKLLFRFKKPDLLFIELNEYEINTSHPSFGVVSDMSDLIFAPILKNKAYFRDFIEGLKSRLDFIRSGFHAPEIIQLSDHGFMPYDTAGDSVRLVRYKLSKLINNKEDSVRVRAKFASGYVEKMVELAQKSRCKVIFLYLPSFGYNGNPVQARPFYEQKAEIWYPPKQILENTRYWHDTWHLSREGADSLTAWIISKLREIDLKKRK